MELFEISKHTIAVEPPAVRVWVGPVSGLLNGGLIAGSVTLLYGREGDPEDDDHDHTAQPDDDADDTSLRRLRVSKSRGGPSVSLVMRMTSSGLEPHTGRVDAAIAAALTWSRW